MLCPHVGIWQSEEEISLKRGIIPGENCAWFMGMRARQCTDASEIMAICVGDGKGEGFAPLILARPS